MKILHICNIIGLLNLMDEKILKKIQELAQTFSECVIFTKPFTRELSRLLRQSKGLEAEIFAKLLIQLKTFARLKEQIHHFDGNEILHYKVDGLKEIDFYSLHLQQNRKYAIRLIVVIIKDKAYFLTAFDEKDAKGKRGYEDHLKNAKHIVKELLDE